MLRRWVQVVAVAGAVLLSPRWLAAQGGVQGKWVADVPEMVKTVDGVTTVESTTTATFLLAARGDSVSGTVSRARSAVTRHVWGRITGDSVVLHVPTQAKVWINGAEETMSLRTIYRFRRAGDRMVGTIETTRDPAAASTAVIPGIERDPLPVTAVRATTP